MDEHAGDGVQTEESSLIRSMRRNDHAGWAWMGLGVKSSCFVYPNPKLISTIHFISRPLFAMDTAKMTPQELRRICKDAKGYATPHLNDKLYCHFKGFAALSRDALAPYTGIKSLFLEGNALSSLDGLPELPELRCLCVRGW